jgi:glycosyltransferase involved in cell wall biosynthesis
MGMGIPVLHGVAGESADIVRREGVGWVFEPENVDELLQGLLTLRQDRSLRERLRAAALAAAHHYDRGVLATRMLTLLRGCAVR